MITPFTPVTCSRIACSVLLPPATLSGNKVYMAHELGHNMVSDAAAPVCIW